MRMRLMWLLAAAMALPTIAQRSRAEDLTLVPDKSEISFVGAKPDESKHEGGFKKFTVDSDANFEDPSKSSLRIEIDTTSLWSDNDKLTNHLKSPDFFDVRKYPSITFESTEIVPEKKEGEKAGALIKGNLKMLGKTLPVEIPVQTKSNEEMVELTAQFKIDRTKWGMSYGDGKINDDVKITAKLMLSR